MPFRARLKRALGGGTSNDDYDPSNPLTHGSSKRAKKDYPENTYKPGESMPRPKYRGPWNQAHQDKLSAFSFGNSWSRRRSSTPTNKSKRRNSEYSPMGSKLPSRGPSRRSSNWSTFSAKASKRAWGMGSRQQSGQNVHDGNQQQSVKEAVEGDDDVMNGKFGLFLSAHYDVARYLLWRIDPFSSWPFATTHQGRQRASATTTAERPQGSHGWTVKAARVRKRACKRKYEATTTGYSKDNHRWAAVHCGRARIRHVAEHVEKPKRTGTLTGLQGMQCSSGWDYEQDLPIFGSFCKDESCWSYRGTVADELATEWTTQADRCQDSHEQFTVQADHCQARGLMVIFGNQP